MENNGNKHTFAKYISARLKLNTKRNLGNPSVHVDTIALLPVHKDLFLQLSETKPEI